MNNEAGKSLINELNAMILLPDKPLSGDYIALDRGGSHPNDFCRGDYAISWYCSQVIAVDGDRYKMSYDDGARWYEFKEFGTPRPSARGTYNTYPALPPLADPTPPTEGQQK